MTQDALHAQRRAKASRTSAETETVLELCLDGTGAVDVKTGFGMLDHMLTLAFFWARMDLKLSCRGDLEVDAHRGDQPLYPIIFSLE